MRSLEENLIFHTRKGHYAEVLELINQHPELNLNCQSPESGRTALHVAIIKHREALLKLLVQRGGYNQTKDKARFIPLDYGFFEVEQCGFIDKEAIDEGRIKTILAYNEQCRRNGFDFKIIYVPFYEEITNVIKAAIQDKSAGRVYLLILTPPVVPTSTKVTHVIPVVFQYSMLEQKDEFIILDSAYSNYLAMPVIHPRHQTAVYYSPFHLQVNGFGCFKYGLSILLHAHLDVELFKFAQFNVMKDSSPVRDEKLRLPETMVTDYHQRFCDRYMELKFITNRSMIFELATLPIWMMLYTEDYRLMRHLITSAPKLHKKIAELFPERAISRENGSADFNYYHFAKASIPTPQAVLKIHQKSVEIQDVPNCLVSANSNAMFSSRVLLEDWRLEYHLIVSLKKMQLLLTEEQYKKLLQPIIAHQFGTALRRASILPNGLAFIADFCFYFQQKNEIASLEKLKYFLIEHSSKQQNCLMIAQENNRISISDFLNQTLIDINKQLEVEQVSASCN